MLKRFVSSLLKHSNVVAFSIITIALVTMVASVWDDSPIVDEIPHIGAGYSYIAKGDHRLNPEHPPLAKDLAGLGVALTNPTENSFTTRYWNQDINGQWEFGRHLIFNSDSDTEKIIKFAKLPVLIFFILTGLIIYIWASRLYGKGAGLIALFLFSFSPTIAAHSRFVTTDVAALFGVMASTFFFVRYLKNSTLRNFLLAGIIFGVAQLTKYSVILLAPFFVIIAIIFGFNNSNRSTVKGRFGRAFDYGFSTVIIILIGFILIVWPYYILHIQGEPPAVQRYQTEKILESFGNRKLADSVIYFSDKPILRGLSQYGLGLLMVVQRSGGGNDAYYMGEFSNKAWKSYFPMVYLLKEPLPFWFLLIGILIFYASRSRPSIKLKISQIWKSSWDWVRSHFIEFGMLMWLALYWYTSIQANLNIGVRHLLPVYGFTFILLSGALVNIFRNIKSKKLFSTSLLLVFLMFAWYLVENIRVFPYYLTYFNQLAGGPSQGYKYVVDSNVDWGQDLKRLTDWVNKNNIPKIHLDYFGWSDQTYYLKEELVWIGSDRYRSKRDFLAENPDGGYIAISATFYMGNSLKPGKDYLWLPLEERLTTIGNSIFVWEIKP